MVMDRSDLHSIQLQILNMAELSFGPRDPAYVVLAPDFTPTGPKIQYPLKDSKFAQILIDDACKLDFSKAVYQIAHECIHLLAPSTLAAVTVFEEGLATAFAHERYAILTNTSVPSSGDVKYDEARKLVEPILKGDRSMISKMRAERPRFNDFDSNFIALHTSIDARRCGILSSEFSTWTP